MAKVWTSAVEIVRALSLWSAALGVLATSGCFYDSRWGQQKQAQQHQAARLAPQKLERQSAHVELHAQRTLTLRVYATPTYQASIVDWEQQFQHQLDCANATLAGAFGVSLQVQERKTFRPQADEEKLDGLLEELRKLDDAQGVDFVVGLARPAPRFAVSADDLGIARLPGQYLVLRAMSDAQEYEAIQAAFTELPEEKRRNLYRARKEHKLCTVLLHEVGHTLGVPHERAATSLMNPRYHVEASGFSEESANILRASLAARSPGQPLFVDATLAQRLRDLLQAPNADWEPKSRDQLLSVLSPAQPARVPPTASQPTALVPAQLASASPSSGLEPDEQRTLDQARAALNEGRAYDALQAAKPLFAKRANVPAVKELRCNVAMAIGGDPDALDAACAGLSPLAN
ncbi:MAG: matrixin family metalloprotease [Myxococcales bacterium]